MRKANAIVTVLIMVLFLIHMIWGGMELAGMIRGGSALFKVLSHTMILLIMIHIGIGIVTTVQTIRACRQSGVSYFRQNRLFWIRRISGFALMLFMICHIVIFTGTQESGTYRLSLFAGVQLATQILMVVCLLVHLLCNITPLRIALGIEDRHRFRTDVLLVLAILLLLAGIAFVVYYIRWKVI